ncbi:MAG: lamin tail domain-containing protein, partial [Lachnospiraceae bacterium]|nr:lamin tail domain-containing protein [Lachnospiraceae bacterium]
MKNMFLQRIFPLLTISALTVVILISSSKTPEIVINEVCSNNFSAACDENGEYSDCIELYNPGNLEV